MTNDDLLKLYREGVSIRDLGFMFHITEDQVVTLIKLLTEMEDTDD